MHQKVQKNTRICATSRALEPLEIKADAMDDVRFVVVARLFSVVCKKGKSMNRNVTKCYKRWWAAIVGVVLQFCWCLQPRLYSNDKFEESFVTITLGQEATNYDRRGQNDNKIGHYRRVNCKLSGSLKFAVLAALELWRTTPAARLADRRPRWYVDSNEQPPNDGHLSPNWN